MFAITTRNSMPTRRSSSFPFDDFFRPLTEMAASGLRTGVRETDDAYYLDAEMPGFEQKDIEMNVKSGTLTIDAEHKTEEGAENESRYGFTERTFHRSFSLDGIDESKISAEYKNGVLSVRLPKMQPAEPESRKIEIQ